MACGLLALTLAAAAPAGAAPAESGNVEEVAAAVAAGARYRSDAGRFEVVMPGTPEIVSTSRTTLGGRVTSTEYSVERGGFEFRVEYHDLPRIAQAVLPTGAILSRAKSEFLDAIEGRERSSVETSLDGYPARSLSFDLAGDRGRVGDGLLTLVGNRLYVVATIRPRQAGRNRLLGRFLKTFTVWPR
jgi:hypothetical protein